MDLSRNGDYTNYRQTFRKILKLKAFNNIVEKSLDLKIDESQKELQALCISFEEMNKKHERPQYKQFYKRSKQLAVDLKHINVTIESQKIKIEQLKSKIRFIDNELAVNSVDIQTHDADKEIEKLENGVFKKKDKENSLKYEVKQLQRVIEDLLLKRRTFQATQNNLIAELMANRQELHKSIQRSEPEEKHQNIRVEQLNDLKKWLKHYQ